MAGRQVAALTDLELRSRLRAAGSGPARIFVGGVAGLALSVRPGRAPSFILLAPVAGHRREFSIGAYGSGPDELSLAAARVAAGDLRKQLRDGIDPAAERAALRAAEQARRAEERERRRAEQGGDPPGSFAELAHAFLASERWRSYRQPTRRAWQPILEDAIALWGGRPAAEIRRGEIAALAASVAAGEGARRRRPGVRAPGAARNIARVLGACFAFGVDAEIVGANPVSRMGRLLPPEGRRDRVLSRAEWRALWTVTSEGPLVYRVFPRLLAYTAARRGELLGAKWSDVFEDEHGAWLRVPAERQKSGRTAQIPLSPATLALLAELRPLHPIWLFPSLRVGGTQPMGEIWHVRRALHRAMAPLLAGETIDPRGWTWHDVRRSGRSLLSEARVQPLVAELFIGHVPLELRGVAGLYDRHDYLAELQDAARALAAKLAEIVGESAAPRASVLPWRATTR